MNLALQELVRSRRKKNLLDLAMSKNGLTLLLGNSSCIKWWIGTSTSRLIVRNSR
ncbi:MAG: hypothetical protein HY785_04870 [Oscillatoriophycideae cyanobacterium NC_groundwater_1537_Pr4_S-0.65um_50_18]|nr:hypothetical protein [Oscillatoriophycideae cyanobacterium NC_groundwater_1537_Pr4_S-0.65um_50_18]